jgi:DNA ligase-1
MAPTPFTKFAELCKALESTRRRNLKVKMLASFLKSVQFEEIVPAVTFVTGRAFPESDDRVLDFGVHTLRKMCKGYSQSTLMAKPVTILDVYRTFDQIAKVAGPGSRIKKENLVKTLLGRLPNSEAEYLLRIIFGEMRVGAVEEVVLEAVAAVSHIQRDLVRRAYMLLGDLGEVAKVCLVQGVAAVEGLGVRLFLPIRPMLAEMAEDLDEVFKAHEGITALEYKYDGARIQIHRKNEKVRIFSRRLTDVTDSLPDIVRVILDRINGPREFLVEGEVIGTGRDGKPVPFQDLMRRFRRVHNVESMVNDIPLQLFLFDLIYLDGEMQIDAPYDERWTKLKRLTAPDLLATRIVTKNIDDAQKMMKDSIASGHEGLMAKSLQSKYTPGARGKNWLKIKPVVTTDVVIVAADWGSGRRRGWLSNYHLAVRDEESDEYLVVGKTFKGLTDDEFSRITRRLLKISTHDSGYTVSVRPSIVVEVAFNEIQRSPHYKSKLALRFARIRRFREDKRPEDADSLGRLEQLYESQFRYKARVDV